jgi:hypothetical protein
MSGGGQIDRQRDHRCDVGTCGLGFGYHEVGRYAESRRLSELSLRRYPGNANASHNIVHVCSSGVSPSVRRPATSPG